jgi:hypothetical protein
MVKELYLQLRLSYEQKEDIRIMAKKRQQPMTQYLWSLVLADKEKVKKEK